MPSPKPPHWTKNNALKKLRWRILVFILLLAITAAVTHFVRPRLIPNTYAAMLEEHPEVRAPRQELMCEEFITHAWRMNDSVHEYLEHSYLHGIGGVLKFAREIQPKADSGKLVVVENSGLYILDTMRYSYPFLTPSAVSLLDEIAVAFQAKLKHTELKNTRLVVTSMLRTVSSVTRLRRRNRNAIRHSAHLHGTTFDITYGEFDSPKELTLSEKEYLKEMLARTLFELRAKDRCWVTYEMWQTCFHIVTR